MDITKKDSSRVQGTEMEFLGDMLAKTRGDTIQNVEVREIVKLDKIQDEIEDSKIRLYGHVKRMNTGRIPRHVLEYQL